jgi:hypothetical protein
MSLASEYRAYAEAAVELAAESNDNEYKVLMIKIAQAWLELADRAETVGHPTEDSHPKNETTGNGEAH